MVEGSVGGLFALHNNISFHAFVIYGVDHTLRISSFEFFHLFSDPYCFLKCVEVVRRQVE